MPLVNGGIFSLLCADPLLCSTVLRTLLLGRPSLPVVLALYLPGIWVVFAVLRAFEHDGVASSTCKA